MVALTFDDGPHPVHTPRLLELLAKHGAKATHFVVGESAERTPELLSAMAAAGNAVGSHTYSHRSLVRLEPPEVVDEVASGHAALGAVAAPLFRPPYGHYDLSTASAVRRAGLLCVSWSATLGDWRKRTTEELAASFRKASKPGAIILMHEALHTVSPEDEPDREPLFEALDQVLEELSGTFRFVTVPELMASGTPVRSLIEWRGEDDFVAAQVRPDELPVEPLTTSA